VEEEALMIGLRIDLGKTGCTLGGVWEEAGQKSRKNFMTPERKPKLDILDGVHIKHLAEDVGYCLRSKILK
jgi:hypothetical protein